MTTRKTRWPVALEGIIAYLLMGALFTWSIYRGPLLELFPSWNDGMLSVVFAVHNVVTCLGILIGGRLVQKYPIRRLFLIYAFIELIGFGGIALLPVSMPGLSFAMLLVMFAGFASFGAGMGVNMIQAATLPWFPDNAGLASGSLFMALGLSSFLLAALSEATLPLLGAKLSMASIGVMIFVVVMLILADPRSMKLPERTEKVVTVNENGITTREMLKKASFWLLLIWEGCLNAIGFILLDHAAGAAVAFAATALMGMLISPANGLGSLVLGGILDKIGLKKNIMLICVSMIIAIALLIAGAKAGSSLAIIFGLVIGGVAYGGSRSTYSAAIERVYGGKYFASNFGVANIAMGIGALISAFSGAVLDSAGGNYTSVFVMAAIVMAPVLICCIVLMKLKLPRY